MSQGFVGTSVDQDFRLKGNKRHNLKIPKILSNRIDSSKINKEFLENYISEKLAFKEDEILEGLLLELISTNVDSEKIYIQANEFLQENTFKIMKEIWEVLVKAQESKLGIPQELIDKKKLELKMAKDQEEAERQRDVELRKKERQLWDIERSEREKFGRDTRRKTESHRDRNYNYDDRGRRDYENSSKDGQRKRGRSSSNERDRRRGRSNSRERRRERNSSNDSRNFHKNNRDRSTSASQERRDSDGRYSRLREDGNNRYHRREDSLERNPREPNHNYSPRQARFQRPR